MKIVLAASIYPPEIGGPSFYAASLKDALTAEGHDVQVAVLSSFRALPKGIRHMRYAYELFRISKGADAIIAFDPLSAGFPALFSSAWRNIPLIVRIGGDSIWESHVEQTGELIPLPDFYTRRQSWSRKEKNRFKIVRHVLAKSIVVYTAPWIRDLWTPVYNIDPGRTHIIENAIPPKLPSELPVRKNFLFMGRQIALKNAIAFRKAFERVRARFPDIELEEGTAPKDELMQRMARCYAAVLPSISDVTPNYILDAVRSEKPFLLTKYSGYAGRFPGCGVIVDPLSEDDMVRGIEELLDEASYSRMKEHLRAFNEVRTYHDIARDFVSLIAKN